MEIAEVLIRVVLVAIIGGINIWFVGLMTEMFEKCYIYISYADKDEGRAKFAIEVIKRQLKSRWWISYKILTKEDIPLGEPISCTKYRFIKRSERCIVFLSDDYIEDSDCQYEFGIMNDSKVIPIFLDWNWNIAQNSKAIIDKNGILLVGCYSHRLIENKMKILAKEL